MLEPLIAFILLAGSATAFSLFGARHIPFAAWSPVYVFPGFYAVLSLGGYIYYRFTSGYFDGFYDLGVSHEQLGQSLAAFQIAIGAFFIGVLAYLILSKRARHARALRQRITTPAVWTSRPNGAIHGKATPMMLGFLLFPLFLTIIGIGPNALLFRTEYLVETYHYILILGSMLSLPAVFYLGVITLAKKSGVWRTACVGLFLSYLLVYLSMSTRRVVVILIFFIVGLSLGGARRRVIVTLTLIFTISLPLFLQIPLELRGMPSQGLSPLPNNLAAIATDQNITKRYAESADASLRNLTFGVPLAGYVGSEPGIPAEVLATSLNPLPSSVPLPGLPSWESLRDSLRASQYIPYSALGELLNHGWLWLIFYYFLIGLTAAWLDIGTRHFEGQRSRLGYIVGCGLLLLFSVTSTQYNLRSATRLVWYAVLIAVSWRFVCRIRVRQKNHKIYPARNLDQATYPD